MMHVIYIKMFNKCKDFLFIMRNYLQVTTSYFLKVLIVMSALFP